VLQDWKDMLDAYPKGQFHAIVNQAMAVEHVLRSFGDLLTALRRLALSGDQAGVCEAVLKEADAWLQRTAGDEAAAAATTTKEVADPAP
jgi:hypothetical protein